MLANGVNYWRGDEVCPGALIITSLLIIPAATARRFARTPEQMANRRWCRYDSGYRWTD